MAMTLYFVEWQIATPKPFMRVDDSMMWFPKLAHSVRDSENLHGTMLSFVVHPSTSYVYMWSAHIAIGVVHLPLHQFHSRAKLWA